jgi:beta-phosphoglucomutase family hydrolase
VATKLGVIFDVDGVLVDSYQAHYQSWQRLGREIGAQMSEQQFVATFGRTSREIIREFWPHLATSDDQVAQIDDRKEELFREILAADFPAMEGAVELIDALAAADFSLAVGSSGPPENVGLVLDKLSRRDRFQAVVTGRDVTRGKPDPQVFLLAAERLGLPPGRCVVIEDAPAGVAAAKAAGAKCLGLASAGRDPALLAAADRVVGSLRKIDAVDFDRLLSQ